MSSESDIQLPTGNRDLAPELGLEKTRAEVSELSPAPDGGPAAWLVAAGGFSIFFCCLGFSNSFGTFEEYYMRNQLYGYSADSVAWIGSIGAFIQFAIGLIAGPLFDRYGASIIRPAALAYIFAMMMLSLCKTYWQIMLVQGVLMGVAMGFMQIPAFAAASQYFDKKRAAAIGFIVSGSSVGGIVIPIAITKMLNSSSLGFGWSVRVIGFLIMPFMLFACITVKARVPPRTTNFFIAAAFKDPKFVLLTAAMLFMFTGMFTPLFYLPSYAILRGMDATLAGYLLAVLNAASTFGRIIPGILADKYGRLNIFAFGGIVTGVVIFCLNSVTGTAGLAVYAVFFGFVSGTIISGGSVSLSICNKDPRDMGTYGGMGFAIAAFGSLIGPPVNGVFISQHGGFLGVSMFSGAMTLCGGIIVIIAKSLTPQGILGRT
ncbi:MFS general substrate transporter [Thozetella sp. PMI_491]|nr:MFS general substrate transporter [Thozetella sp. PMI_491]